MFTFAPIPPYQPGGEVSADVSDDRRAITLSLPDFQVKTEAGGSPVMETRVFTLTLPVAGDGLLLEAEFTVDGFALTEPGATATLVISVNGQSTIIDFPGGTDRSFVQIVKLATEKPAECRLCVMLLLSRASDIAANAGFINVPTINVEMLPHAT